MPSPARLSFSSGLWLLLLVSSVLTGCAARQESAPAANLSTETQTSAAMPPPAEGRAVAEQAAGAAPSATDAVTSQAPQSQPKMVRTAQMQVEVESVTQSLDKVAAIARLHQGEMIGLQEQAPQGGDNHHTAWVQLRVPQAQLDQTLEALVPLGTVQAQSITAEDVSTQLVDYQARLKNLRQTEEMLLSIMKRAGDMTDVLRVAQEVSNVRQSIESLDAQLANLQTQVAYSIITLDLYEATATLTPQTPVLEELADTWTEATHSVGQFTTGILKLLTWLAAYSPYGFALLLGGWLFARHRQRGAAIAPPPVDPADS